MAFGRATIVQAQVLASGLDHRQIRRSWDQALCEPMLAQVAYTCVSNLKNQLVYSNCLPNPTHLAGPKGMRKNKVCVESHTDVVRYSWDCLQKRHRGWVAEEDTEAVKQECEWCASRKSTTTVGHVLNAEEQAELDSDPDAGFNNNNFDSGVDKEEENEPVQCHARERYVTCSATNND